MPAVFRLALLCAAALLVVGNGCAPAYHAYSGCCINCRYCALPPLPFTHYKGCVCHSCAASQHLAIQPPATDAEASDTEGENSTE